MWTSKMDKKEKGGRDGMDKKEKGGRDGIIKWSE